MSELIPLTHHNGIQAVMGRDLYNFLEVKEQYADWMKRMVGYGFTEGTDYVSQKPEAGANRGFIPGGNRVDHIVTLDMAKEISMIQRTERGKQARQYFLECERKAKQKSTPALPQTYAEALRELATTYEQKTALEAQNTALKTENRALTGGEGITIRQFIKTYFTAPNERAFFEWFYYHGYLIDGRQYNEDGTSARSGSGPKHRWDHQHPTYIGRAYFKLVPTGTKKYGGARAKVIPEKALNLVQLLLKAKDLPTQMTKQGQAAYDQYTNPGQLHAI